METTSATGNLLGWENDRVKRSGIADLPLHGGRVPPWLASRMTTLGTAIAESVIHHYGRGAFLSRLSDPFWFQALGCVMGMDWHSSGITTSVMGALKRGLNPRAHELGIYISGGRGRHSPWNHVGDASPNDCADAGSGERPDRASGSIPSGLTAADVRCSTALALSS